MKNWLKFWKERRTDDLEHSLRADRPQAPKQLVKAIMGDVRRRPVRPQVRLGRALVGATALAVLAVTVSVAAGLGVTGGAKHSISFAPTGGSGGSQYVTAPVITSVSPSSGNVGDSIDIGGSGFTGVDTVSFNGTSATTFNVVSDSEIMATVPTGATTGPITVHNSAGSASSPSDFIVAPTITSLSTNSGSIGDQVIITGTNFLDTTSVKFNGITATFAIDTNTQITTTVPVGATDGPITVTNAGGTATSGTFTIAPSNITFSPASGNAGQVVVITGKYFTGATAVKFNGTNAGSFHVDSDTQITAVVASGTTTGHVGITTPDGTGTSAGNFTIIATPVVSSFAPTSGGPGSSVVITGSHFTGATAVKFHSTSTSSFTVNSDTQITATVPTGATSGQISVTNSQGTGTSAGSFTVLSLPNVASFSPTSGPAGATVTINGSKFTGATAVNFNGTPSTSVIVNADNKITATVPAGATTGRISVTTAAGTGTSTGGFTVIQTPTISSFTPSTSSQNGSVTVLGSGFTGATSVQLGTTAATFTFNSDSQITLKVPGTIANGSYSIKVTNAAGTGTSATMLVVQALTAPSITSFSPSSGPSNAQNQTVVTINGSGFTGTSSVTFGSKAATGITINGGGTQIMATSPIGATTGTITVTNPAGHATTTTPFTVVQPPTVVSFSPTSGLPGTTNVTISGTNLIGPGTLGVSFNGTAATTIVSSTATQVVAQVPAGATTGQITVSDSGIGFSTSSGTFVVIAAPTISSFSPVSGKGGTLVTINGSGFLGGSTPSVSFNGTSATGVKVVSNTVLTAMAPASPPATSGPITVTNAAGSSGPSATSFLYQTAPTVTSFSPTHGPANASMTTLVDITGTNFVGATNVSFGSKAAAFFSVNSATDITASAPIGAATGKITVTTPSGTGASATSFVVDPPPVITGFTPKPPAGAIVSGAVTITGMNFNNADPLHLSFNGTNQPTFTVVSPTSITTTVPAGATTGPITVTDDKTGSGTSSASFIVIQTPTIASFSPESGIVGTKVTVLGSGFSGATTSVFFNGTLAKTVAFSSDTSLTATVPSGASTGTIMVSNAAGSATSADTFVVALKPTLTAFDPVSGPGSAMATTVVDIGGTNFNGTTAVLFGTTASPFVTVDDNNDITAVVPAGAKSGKITVVNPAGSAMSSGIFTVDPPPSITSMTPTRGATGDVVTINGNGFIGEMGGTPFPADTTVDFVGSPGAVIDSITNTRIQVEVPAFAFTGPLVVTNAWGEMATSPIFSVIQTPSISSFLDEFNGTESGPVGDPVLIFGQGFTGTSEVDFNGTPATSFAVVGDFEIIARVPRGATTGTIKVTNEAGNDTSADTFTVTG